MSMMSTRPDRVISLICSRYSSSVRKRTSPECISGDWPGAPMPSAMSASLASAMMNSRQPGSAWIAASLVSRDFFMTLPVSFALPRDGDARMPRRAVAACRAHGHPRRAMCRVAGGGGLDAGAAPLPAGLAAAFLLLFNTASIVSRSTWAECWRADVSLGQSSISRWSRTPLRPTTVGTEIQTSRRP